jgi:hypothetical protein
MVSAKAALNGPSPMRATMTPRSGLPETIQCMPRNSAVAAISDSISPPP